MTMVPTPIFKLMCSVVIDATTMSMDRLDLIQSLDIDIEELDEVIAYCKKNNEV